MPRPPHPCLTCGRPITTRRCTHCGPRYTNSEQQRMAQAVAAHRATHGDWCPGSPWCDPTGHPSTDLTADHITPRTTGGTGGPLRILCRSANSRRAGGHKPQP